MTNRGLLFILCCLLAGAACTQPRSLSKGYAYSRQTSGGAAPVGTIDEKGVAQPAAKGGRVPDYLIYVQRKETSALVVDNVWINGRNWAAEAEPVTTNPVQLPDDMAGQAGKPLTLVPATRSKVWQLLLKGLKSPNAPIPVEAKEAAGKPAVIIEYHAGNARKFFSIPVIKNLGAVSLQ